MKKLIIMILLLEIIRLWYLKVEVWSIIVLLTMLMLIALPISMLIINIGRTVNAQRYEGKNIEIAIAIAMLWIVTSVYIMHYYTNDIINYVHSITH